MSAVEAWEYAAASRNTRTPEDKYWRRVRVDPMTDCHIMPVGVKSIADLRLDSWALWRNDPLPRFVGMSCDTHRCTNPDHMEPADTLCRKQLHPRNASNLIQINGYNRCAACFWARECKVCGRTIDPDNTYFVKDHPAGCLWCRHRSDALRSTIRRLVDGVVKKVRCDHQMLRPGSMVLTHHNQWRCSICWAQRVCPQGHLQEGNSWLHDMNAPTGLVQAERCKTCHTHELCNRGHDLTDPKIGVIQANGHKRCSVCNRMMANRRPRAKSVYTPEEQRLNSLQRKMRDRRQQEADPVLHQLKIMATEDRRRLLWRLERYFETGDPNVFVGPDRINPSYSQRRLAAWLGEHGHLFDELG